MKAKAQVQKWGKAFRWQCESDTSGRRVGGEEDWEGEPPDCSTFYKGVRQDNDESKGQRCPSELSCIPQKWT